MSCLKVSQHQPGWFQILCTKVLLIKRHCRDLLMAKQPFKLFPLPHASRPNTSMLTMLDCTQIFWILKYRNSSNIYNLYLESLVCKVSHSVAPVGPLSLRPCHPVEAPWHCIRPDRSRPLSVCPNHTCEGTAWRAKKALQNNVHSQSCLASFVGPLHSLGRDMV